MRLLKKILLYGLLSSLLASCSLFTSIPPKVAEGQRIAHQGVVLIENNIISILDQYEKDNQNAVTYHIMFIYEQRIEELKKDEDLTQHELSVRIEQIRTDRQHEINAAFVKIAERKKQMLDVAMKNTLTTKKLIEAVYSYMSATPITIDNLDFWIVKIVEADRGRE